jgi:2,4-dienoyl-CoA reductase-like NADH-dependent reductase (Old Yellow Enzyme family)
MMRATIARNRDDDTARKVLLAPIALGSLTVPNRITVSAHSYNFGSDGLPNDALISYVARRVEGGVGLIVLGETQVTHWPMDAEGLWGSFVSSDESVDLYRRLVAACRPRGDALIIEQLTHPGGQAWPTPEARAVAPSRVVHDAAGLVPTSLSPTQITDLVEHFAIAAERASQGGLDGVELKCDQGKLIHQFLSAEYNNRTDRWGGVEIGQRLEFLRRCLIEIRKRCRPGFVVGVRLAGDTYPTPSVRPRDLRIDDTVAIARVVEQEGLADYIGISGATNSDALGYLQSHGDSEVRRSTFAALGRAVKAAVELPLILAGRIDSIAEAADVVSSGCADLVAMTRAHIADPDVVAKLRNGETRRIRPCVHCNQSCVGNTWEGRELRCIHNPLVGFEQKFGDVVSIAIGRAPTRVTIVGAGPAGLEAAVTAVAAGAEVTLVEAGCEPGGQVLAAAALPGRHKLGAIIGHRLSNLRESSRFVLQPGQNVSVDDLPELLELGRVIVASGSAPDPNRAFAQQTVDALEFASQDTPLVGGVLVLDEDWKLAGLSLARLAKTRGAPWVVLATRQDFVGSGLDFVSHTRGIVNLDGATMLPWHVLAAISGRDVELRNTVSRRLLKLQDVEVVVDASAFVPRGGLVTWLTANAEHNWIAVGDCRFARGIEVAIRESHIQTRHLLGA